MYYILKDKEPVRCQDSLKFAEWLKESSLVVKSIRIKNYTILTIFLGIDLNHQDEGDPVLFETIVFEKSLCNRIEIDRYCTWEEAMNGHHRLLNKYTKLPSSAN
ncbi:MAG: hypothetical protein AAGG68_24355 [Bacteroidota bacterium]